MLFSEIVTPVHVCLGTANDKCWSEKICKQQGSFLAWKWPGFCLFRNPYSDFWFQSIIFLLAQRHVNTSLVLAIEQANLNHIPRCSQ